MTRYKKVSNTIRGGDGHIISESTKEDTDKETYYGGNGKILHLNLNRNRDQDEG
jgi:hypothetical protein